MDLRRFMLKFRENVYICRISWQYNDKLTMTVKLPTFSERVLNTLAKAEWAKALAFLQKQFGLSEDECKDVFQEAFVILHKNNLSGKLEDMTSSLSTYFYSICRNKAYEAMRKERKNVHVEDDVALDVLIAEIQADKIDALIGLENESSSFIERKEALVRQIVRELPPPCDKLLWGFFRDGFSMKTLAQMFNYNSENSVKVTKHRCQNKFRDRFNELKDQLF
jgi:RNA polymerase sigma-70 factor (ECF subfamily)